MGSSRFSLSRPAVRAALEAALPSLDASPAFERAALAICGQIYPSSKSAEIVADMAELILARVPSKHDKALLAHCHALLFEEIGLRVGDEDLAGFLLASVLATRRGSTLVLAMIYKLILARLGIVSRGIAIPGRLLVAVEIDGGTMLVDVAAGGRVISLGEALACSRSRTQKTGPARDPMPALGHAFWLGEVARRIAEQLAARGCVEDAGIMKQISTGLRNARPIGKEVLPAPNKLTAEDGPSQSNLGRAEHLEEEG